MKNSLVEGAQIGVRESARKVLFLERQMDLFRSQSSLPLSDYNTMNMKLIENKLTEIKYQKMVFEAVLRGMK